MLDPSQHINEKFFTYIFTTSEGKAVTGLIVEETPDTVKIMENPLAKCDPTILKKSDIEERTKSKTSMMPKGLLDQLTKDEILDLIAFVYSHGNPQHKLFQGEPASRSP